MASRFWVGGTGTWDASDTTHWAATSGGAGGQTVPGSSDTVTFDANSGGGTVTPNTPITIQQITAGTFTGTLAFNTNNNDVTLNGSAVNAVSFTGTGVRTINMGSGTWTLSGGGGFDCGTATNLTATFSNAAIVMSGNVLARTFSGGGQTYASLTISDNSTKGFITVGQSNTFASITAGSGNTILFSQGTTQTITGALTINGTSSAPSGAMSNSANTNAATVSVGSASTITWGAIQRITKSGAGSITATDSFDLGGNTSVTITAPSGGAGGGGQRVISG